MREQIVDRNRPVCVSPVSGVAVPRVRLPGRAAAAQRADAGGRPQVDLLRQPPGMMQIRLVWVLASDET